MHHNSRILVVVFTGLFAFLMLAVVTLPLAQAADQSPSPVAEKKTVSLSNSYQTVHRPAVLPDTTKNLSPDTIQHLTDISADGRFYTFSAATAELAAVAVGDVIISDQTALAPHGFLRKVTAITTQDGRITFETVPASITDAIESVHLSINQELTKADLQHVELQPGVTAARVPEDELFSYTLTDFVIYDEDGDENTTDDQIIANGGITVEISYEFDLDVDVFSVDSLTFLVNITETAELFIESDDIAIPHTPLIEKTLLEYEFAPIPTGVPGITVVPQFELRVGLSGQLQGSISTGVTQQLIIGGGILYDGDDWEDVGVFSNTFDFIPPDISIASAFAIRAYSEAELSLLVNGLLGPSFEAEPYLQLDVDPEADPWWTLSGGLDVDAGLNLDLDLFDLSYDTDLVRDRVVLATYQDFVLHLPFVTK